MILGLTGGIGTGKSTVANMLKKKGIPVVDTDLISREVIEYPEIIEKIKLEISNEVFDFNNKLDRKKMSEIVFENQEKLKKNHKIIVLDIPLLFEINMEKEVDKILLIYASKEIQLKRIMERDCRSREEAIKIINSQIPLYKKREKSDYIIQNNDSLENLEKKLEKILEKL